MSEGEKAGGEGRKLSRLEREREKIRVATDNINRLLAEQKKGQRKLETQQKVLLGVMLQRMITDGTVKAETFTKYSQTLTNRDRKIVEDYWAGLDWEESEE